MGTKFIELRKKRKAFGVSRQELSDLSGVHPQTIMSLETGKTDTDNVKLSTLIALADALECKVVDLLPNDVAKKIA